MLTLRDIHVRFEDNVFCTSPYALGVTLQDLTVVTTNENWEPQYIDRTDKANHNKPLYKHLKLHGLTIYLKAHENAMISLLEEGSMEEKMKEGIAKQCHILRPRIALCTL